MEGQRLGSLTAVLPVRGTLLVLSRYLLKYTGYKGIYAATSSLIVTDYCRKTWRETWRQMLAQSLTVQQHPLLTVRALTVDSTLEKRQAGPSRGTVRHVPHL